MITPFFTHYKNWEDWQNGMYRDVSKEEYLKFVEASISVLRDPKNAMAKVVEEWPMSSRQNLSDFKSNRRSWLGQAACCLQANSPEQCTREAWGKLTNKERINANKIAEKTIRKWEESICPNLFSMLPENE